MINGITTYYASSGYVVEVDDTTTTVRKTYSAGSTSLAVRTIVNGTTYYLFQNPCIILLLSSPSF
ncbi:MAG: hypothetical protein JEZ00_09680 [Anaerolineaceae bacterium]|nr:hypothetical protein [Anaerolineaceae bacterium]